MSSSNSLVLRNCTIVDSSIDAPVPGGAVWVVDGVIRMAGSDESVTRQASESGATEIDMDGAYLAPGLVNMHAHLSLELPGKRGDELNRMSIPEWTLYMADGARRSLLSGVTTIRCVGEKHHIEYALRSAIEKGRAIGPRIFTAGQSLCCTGGHGHGRGHTLEYDGADDFRRGVRTEIRAGADLIKVKISGGIAGEHEQINTRQMTADEMHAVIETAHDWGRKVTAHAGPAAVIGEAVEIGLDCVEHGYQLTPQVTDLMAQKGCSLVPTLVVSRCKDFFDQLEVPEWMQQRAFSAGDQHVRSYQMALASGVEVLLGSDMPPFWSLDGTSATVRELEYMSEFGLDPRASLRAATSGPAKWLGVEDKLGHVAQGQWADLVAMKGDPTDDVSAWRTIWWVMKDGEVVRDDRQSRNAAW